MPRKLQQWEIWGLDQVRARQGTSPPQPLDPSNKGRPYLIICPQAHLDSGGDLVLVPIGEQKHCDFSHVPLADGEAGVRKACHIWCNQIVTVPERFLLSKAWGRLGADKVVEVQNALRDFLELH